MADETRQLLSRLRFRHLQMLRALADTGGIRRAAQRLNLTQPAVSKALVISALPCPVAMLNGVSPHTASMTLTSALRSSSNWTTSSWIGLLWPLAMSCNDAAER